MPFLLRNISIQRFWTNNIGLRARRTSFLTFLRLEAWRRGRILIMPARHAPLCRFLPPHTHTFVCTYTIHIHTQRGAHTHYTDTDQIESTFIWIVARPLSITQPRSGAWVRLAVIIYQLIPKRK